MSRRRFYEDDDDIFTPEDAFDRQRDEELAREEYLENEALWKSILAYPEEEQG